MRPQFSDDRNFLNPVATLALLRTVPPKERLQGIGINVVEGYSTFMWDVASTATFSAGITEVPTDISSSAAYIADPTSAPGRWIKNAAVISGGAVVGSAVADLTALAAIGSGSRTNSEMVGVLADNSVWQFVAASSAAASDTVVVPAVGTGRWLRMDSEGLVRVHAAVADVTALKAIAAVSRFDGMLAINTTDQGLWEFVAASSATGDDITVATPAAGTGRWLRVNSANAAIVAPVATLTALKAIGSAYRVNGMLATVTADGSRWRFVAASSLTNDDFLVAAPAVGTGRWIRADNYVDITAAVTFSTADNAVLYTVPTGFKLQLGIPYWNVGTSWSGGTNSAIGLSSSNAGLSTAGDLLGGAGGDVAAGLLSTGAYAKGTVGAKIGKPGAVLIAAETVKFNRVVDAFTAGAATAHIPVFIAAAP
jgi:hypothetical protein